MHRGNVLLLLLLLLQQQQQHRLIHSVVVDENVPSCHRDMGAPAAVAAGVDIVHLRVLAAHVVLRAPAVALRQRHRVAAVDAQCCILHPEAGVASFVVVDFPSLCRHSWTDDPCQVWQHHWLFGKNATKTAAAEMETREVQMQVEEVAVESCWVREAAGLNEAVLLLLVVEAAAATQRRIALLLLLRLPEHYHVRLELVQSYYSSGDGRVAVSKTEEEER